MSIEAWASVVTLAILLIMTIAGVVYRFSKIESKIETHDHEEIKTLPALIKSVESIEERAKEDREKNSCQHQEFYDFRRSTEPVQAEILQQLTNIVGTQGRILDKIDEMERRIK